MKYLFCLLAILAPLQSPAEELDHHEDHLLTGLTLTQAVQIALQKHPHLAEAAANLEAAKARATAAGKLPEPDLVARMESAPLSGAAGSEAEYLAGISQSLPLGKRLSAARKASQAEATSREKQLELAVLDLTRSVHGAFATALFTAEVLETHSNITSNLTNLLRITQARVESGDAAPLDLARIQAEEARQRLELKEAATLHREALHGLSLLLGDYETHVASLSGNLEESLQIATMESLLASYTEHPAIAATESEVASRRARVDLARAERIPDVNVELLYRRLQGTRENAFDVGLRVPIPLFSGRRARVREAESELRAAEARMDRIRNEVGHELHARELALEGALGTISILRKDVLPKMDQALTVMEARYSSGDISLSELILARRESAEQHLKYLDALRRVLHAWAGLTADSH